MILALALFFTPSALVGLFVAVVAVLDHHASRADCSPYGGKLTYSSAEPELERMRSGEAFAEAMALQRDEIRALPETRARRSTWS